MLQFQICYHSHLIASYKTKTNIDFRGQAWIRPLKSAGSGAFFYPISIIMKERKLGAKPGTAPDWKVLGQGLDFSP